MIRIFYPMKHILKTFTSLVLIFISTLCVAQPNTEIYLFDIRKEGDQFFLSDPRNITNNEGYDNQPSFWPDGKSLLYARTVGDQTEIARYSLANGETTIISNTLQGSEYSPTAMPDGRISSIRLDTTGLQRLYAYDLEGNSEVLVPELVIGYHAWINKKEIVTFVLGDPATMQIINVNNGKANTVASNIGRSLHVIPNSGYFSYVDKSAPQWVIGAMNSKEKKQQMTIALEGSEDYCWAPTGEIIMGQGSKLFHWKRAASWVQFADLANYNLEGISRLAMSPDGTVLAVVVNK